MKKSKLVAKSELDERKERPEDRANKVQALKDESNDAMDAYVQNENISD